MYDIHKQTNTKNAPKMEIKYKCFINIYQYNIIIYQLNILKCIITYICLFNTISLCRIN